MEGAILPFWKDWDFGFPAQSGEQLEGPGKQYYTMVYYDLYTYPVESRMTSIIMAG